MSHGQNAVFGISGNLAKLVFAKILPADASIRNQLVFYFSKSVLQFVLPNIRNFPQNLLQITKLFIKNSSNRDESHQQGRHVAGEEAHGLWMIPLRVNGRFRII